MAVEIVEEPGCEGKMENIGGIGKQQEGANEEEKMTKAGEADEEHEGEISWDSSFSSAFRVSSSGIDVNGSDDLLWNEIDLAERYLVSAMNEDAASTATTVLQTLSSLMHSSSSAGFGSVSVSCCSDRDEKEEVEGVVEVGKSDHEEMLECAGMVLLQSYRAIGRVGEFFDILRKLNVGVAEWPLVLLETGACLQISDGAFPAARAALEEFLAVQSTCLSEEKYSEVLELFVIKVLVKGLQEIETALDWVERANLTQETRLVILKKIRTQTERVKAAELVAKPDTESTTMTASVDIPSPTKASFDSKDTVKEKETKGGKDLAWETDICLGADESSIRTKSLTLLKRLKVSEGFFSLKTLLELALLRLSAASSACQSLYAANLEGRALRLGVLVALSLFLFLRHGHSLRRIVGKSFSALKVGLSDLWQLAFSVQINPLAAVHPISAAY